MTDNRRRRSAVRAVMFFAKEPETCGRWWAEQLAPGREVHVEAGGFCWFDLDGVEVGFHPADEERNPVGGSPVVYWSVTDFDTQRRQLLEAGCQPHRGPLDIQPGRRISQLVDPFGNIFGIDGLRQQERPAEGKASAWVVGSVTETSHATGSARDPNRTRPTMTEQAGPDLNTSRPHPARVYDYLLGGCFP